MSGISNPNKVLYPSLDGIRGMAFLIVFFVHLFAQYPVVLPHLVGVGKYGVWLFFILSSFLLTNYFIMRPEKVNSPLEWFNYLVRRMLRVYPVYIVVLLFALQYKFDIKDTGMVSDHLLLQTGVAHFWTMPVEIGYYALLPLVVLGIVFLCKINIWYTLLGTGLVVGVHQLFFPYTSAVENSTNVIQYIPIFVLGSALSVVHKHLTQVEISSRTKIAMDAGAVLILIGLFLCTPYPLQQILGELPQKYLMNKFIFLGLAWGVFILFVLHGQGAIRKLFENRILRFFGAISYSGYLIHMTFIQIIISSKQTQLSLQNGLIVFALTMLSAGILHILIERPSMKVNLLKLKRKQKIVPREAAQ